MSNDAYLRLVKAVRSVRDTDPRTQRVHGVNVEVLKDVSFGTYEDLLRRSVGVSPTCTCDNCVNHRAQAEIIHRAAEMAKPCTDPNCGEPHASDEDESGVWTYRTSDVVSDGAYDDRILLGDSWHPWWIVRAWRWLLGKIRS